MVEGRGVLGVQEHHVRPFLFLIAHNRGGVHKLSQVPAAVIEEDEATEVAFSDQLLLERGKYVDRIEVGVLTLEFFHQTEAVALVAKDGEVSEVGDLEPTFALLILGFLICEILVALHEADRLLLAAEERIAQVEVQGERQAVAETGSALLAEEEVIHILVGGHLEHDDLHIIDERFLI